MAHSTRFKKKKEIKNTYIINFILAQFCHSVFNYPGTSALTLHVQIYQNVQSGGQGVEVVGKWRHRAAEVGTTPMQRPARSGCQQKCSPNLTHFSFSNVLLRKKRNVNFFDVDEEL